MKEFKNLFGITLILYVFACMALLSGCANNEVVTPCLTGYTYGFLGGLWHGIIAPIDLVMMLFSNEVTVYAQNNNGAWYAFGFIIGSGGWGVLGNKATSKRH